MEPNNQTMIEIYTMKMVFCKFIFTLLAITFFATNAEAQKEEYAVFDNGTLTFYYNNDKSTYSSPNIVYDIVYGNNPEWLDKKDEITTVVFDKSFADARPTNLAKWFENCSQLTTITDIVYLNTSEVTTMERLFYNCSKLTELNLAYFCTYRVTNMKEMFYNCENLTKIYVGYYWSVYDVGESTNMFYNCEKLEGEEIKSKSEDYTNYYKGNEILDFDKTFAKINDYYNNGGLLTHGKIPYVKYYDYSNTAWRYTYNIKDNDYLLVFRFDDQWENIGGRSNYFSTDNTTPNYHNMGSTTKDMITRVYFDEGFGDKDNILLSYANWFNGFSSLETIKGLDWYPELYRQILNTGVTNLSGMFKGCSSLKTIDLRCIKTDNVTDMSSMFEGCTNLEAIFVNENWVTEQVTNYTNIFNGCDKLKGDDGTFPDGISREKLGKGDYTVKITEGYVINQNNNKVNVKIKGQYDIYQYGYYGVTFELADEYKAKYEVEHWEYTTTREPAITHTVENNIEDAYVMEIDPIGDITVTAYLNLRYYTVTFKDGDDILSSTSCPYGSSVNKPNDPTPKKGYAFFRWTVGQDKTSKEWDFDNKTITTHTDIYAQWTINSHKLTYKIDNEVDGKVETVEYGTTLTLRANPQKEGSTFSGWKIDGKDIPERYTMPDNDVEITGSFAINQYTVYFYDSDESTEPYKSITADYGATITTPESPTRDGFEFIGWYPQVPSTMPLNGKKCIAQWKELGKVSITFDIGTDEVDAPKPISGYPGEPVDVTIQDLVWKGHTFDGWDPKIPTKFPTDDITITAQWKTISYYLTYKIDNEVYGEVELVEYGKTLTLRDNPEKEGYTFSGWSSLPKNMPDEDVTVTGSWKKNPEGEKQKITPTLSDADNYISFPKNWKNFCKKQETEAELSYIIENGGEPNLCNITIETIEGSYEYLAKDGKVNITKLPTLPGEYACSAVFKGNEELTLPSDTIKFTLEITAAHGLILQLYKNVLFVNNISEKFETYQWYRYGEETDEKLPNGERQYFTEPTLKGSYWALLNNKIHACPMDNPVSVKQAEVSIKTYPNPAIEGELFTIEINNFDPETEYTMIISNSNGNIVKKLTVTDHQTTLSLPRGIYTGALMSSGEKQSFKLIVR